MNTRIPTLLAGSIALGLTASTSFAQLAPYSEDFEGLDQSSPSALSDAGWLGFANVFDGGGNFLYNYGPFGAPNGGPGFSAIATGQGGVDQGAQQLVTYSDYNNPDHANGFLIETNVFQEQVVGAGDVGKTFKFQFDAKLGDLVAPSTALAFIKIIDSGTFGLDGFASFDTHTLPTTWGTYSVSITIDANHVGDFFQIGFLTNATNFNPSGIFYDNLVLGEDVVELSPYAEDFEELDQSSPSALSDAGWLVFANVFDGGGVFLYNYGSFGAPNGGPGFCAIAAGEGGVDQGAQQLVTYSDYNNADHGNGFLIETNVFQEQIVGAGDVGKTFIFQFDAKLGDLVSPSTTSAFIKIIDSNTFGLDGFASIDTTNLPVTWGTYCVEITIEPVHVGDFFQIGFQTNATNFNPSGIVYDNIVLDEGDPCATTYCGSDQNANNVATISVDTCTSSAPSINITMSGGPSGQFVYLLVGDGNGTVSQPPGAVGDLCVAGGSCLGRYAGAIGQIDGAGNFNTDVKAVSTGNPNCPANVQFTAGATWNFQYWHRQDNAPATFSEAISVTFK